MFSDPQHLSIHSPSSTTVSYIVSTRRQNASRILVLFRHFLRLVVIWHVLLINLSKASTLNLLQHRTLSWYTSTILRTTLVSNIIGPIAESTQWYILAPASLVLLYLCLRRDYNEEALLVLQGLGIQTSTSSPYFFLGPTTTFIPTSQVQDIVIHEAFRGLEVRFYLAVIVEGATEVVVVFPTLLPRREVLEIVWRGARKCLYSGIR